MHIYIINCRLMMIMTNLVLTTDPLLHTIFAHFICVLTSTLVVLVFWGMAFFHQQESSPKLVAPCILLVIKVLISLQILKSVL